MAPPNQIILRPAGAKTIYRRQPRLTQSSSGHRAAVVAGETAAECAAVFCCCPFTVVNLVVLGVYKLPAGICRKAIRQRRRRRMMKKKGAAAWMISNSTHHHHKDCCCCDCCGWDPAAEMAAVVVVGNGNGGGSREMTAMMMDKDLVELDNEMWDKFYSAGFWRSPSQREQL